MRRPTTTGRIDYSKATNREAAYVGFANIPNQVFRRAIKQGFDFNLMVVGKLLITFSIIWKIVYI